MRETTYTLEQLDEAIKEVLPFAFRENGEYDYQITSRPLAVTLHCPAHFWADPGKYSEWCERIIRAAYNDLKEDGYFKPVDNYE